MHEVKREMTFTSDCTRPVEFLVYTVCTGIFHQEDMQN